MLSRPFRESNDKTEAMRVLGTDCKLLGRHGRMRGLGINHPLNERGQPWRATGTGQSRWRASKWASGL